MDRAPRPCPYPECGELTLKAHCPAHAQDGRAGPYGGDWRTIRARWLALHPWCALCGAKADEVDHRKMISAGGPRLARTNFRSLCGPCHRKITAKATRTPTWRRPR